MSSKPDEVIKLSDTLSFHHYPVTSGDHGYWLWDETQKMNLALREKTERDAFVKALHYYQRYLKQVKDERDNLQTKIDAIAALVVDKEDD